MDTFQLEQNSQRVGNPEWPKYYFRTKAQPGTSRALSHQFVYSAIGLIDRHVRVRAGARVGIGDGNAAEELAAANPGLLTGLPVRSVETKGCIGIPVSPAVNRDPGNIGSGIKPRGPQHAAKLIPNVSLKLGKRCLQQLDTAGAILIADRQAGLARRSEHEQNRRILRLAGKLILAEAHGKIESGKGMVAAG